MLTFIYFQIYTDWANHYLEKARSKRYISDLQQDVTDGVLLADVIEAVSKYIEFSFLRHSNSDIVSTSKLTLCSTENYYIIMKTSYYKRVG